MDILLTGGSGFVGRSILSQLGAKHSIVAPSSREFNLTNSDEVDYYIDRHSFKFIINCAVNGGRRTKIDTEKDFYDNIRMVDNLLKHVNGDRKLITFSSGAEIYNPSSFYGFSKKICTSLVANKPNIKNLRIYNVFGPSGMKNSFVYATIEKCLTNEDVIIWDDKLFDVFYIDDLIQLIKCLIDRNSCDYQEIECVYEQKYKLSDIAKLIASLTVSDSRIIVENDTKSRYIGEYDPALISSTPLGVSLSNVIGQIRSANDR